MTRRLHLDDLTRFVAVSDPQISPELDKVAYVTVRADRERDDYESTVWIVDRFDGRPVRFLSGGKDRHPRWSPDGRQILFLSDRGLKEGEKGVGLWVFPVYGGEPRMVVRMEKGIADPRWSSDDGRVFFVSGVGEEDEEVRVIDSIPIWFNAEGFTYYVRKQLHVVDVASGVVTQLTNGETSIITAAPSNKGDRVAYAVVADELNPGITDLFVLDLATGERNKIASGFAIASLCWSPDDGQVAFLGNDRSRGNPTHSCVWIVPSDGGAPENLTAGLDRGSSRRHYHDLRSPYAGMPVPVWDDGHIYFPVSEGGTFNLYSVDPESTEIEPVLEGEFSLEEFSVRDSVVAYTRVRTTDPAEIWVRDGDGERRLTNFNDYLVSEIGLSGAEAFEFEASDGARVEGWVLKPFGFEESGRYPAIVDIHGGPRSKYGDSLMFEHQLYAAGGYGVVYANIRGSDGYDQEFADIRGNYELSYQDLMEAVEYVLGIFEWIDPERLGVTGLSYGGFMTNWVVTHTDRFGAAISQNGICSWPSFFGTSDIGFHFTPDQVGGDPWTNEEGYREKSPITHAGEVSTPIMFVHSYNDYRCWIDQSILFYTALKYLGKEARLVFFMEGSHVFRSLAKPSIRRRRLEQMLGWFDDHLKAGGSG
ncbi:MAG: S9 family peptidase [Candidatus Bathyarchaeota archaeon]|nr:S9 family peptidase [Candidatus Bathyarchaeota archaeon]